MKLINCFLASLFILINFSIFAEETANQETDNDQQIAYISDDLFIYMHAGAGNNYRILGSINSGDEVVLTGQEANNYTQIVDNKGRTAWVESKYVSTKPGLRVVIAELNTKLAGNEESSLQLSDEISQANNQVSALNSQNEQLKIEITKLKQQLTQTQAQLSTQDLAIKKEYFFNGAIVLGLGLLLGLIIPRLPLRKRQSMESWR